jgi:hypothetical protein
MQVDNLCQVLPQDRVSDFSKMNPQALLQATQTAVWCRCQLLSAVVSFCQLLSVTVGVLDY